MNLTESTDFLLARIDADLALNVRLASYAHPVTPPAAPDAPHQRSSTRAADDPDQTPGEAPQVRGAAGGVIPTSGRYVLTDGGRMLAVVPCRDLPGGKGYEHPAHEHSQPLAAYGLWCEG